MVPALRLYLDHADLCGMADGKLPVADEALLRAAILETGAQVMYSDAHTFDLAESDEATFDRWCRLVERLGPAFRIRFADAGVEIVPLDLDEARIEYEQVRAMWPALKDMAHAAGVAGHDAYRATGPLPKGTSMRKLANQVLELSPEESIALVGVDINAAIAALGVSRDEVIKAVAGDSKEDLAQGGIVAAVRTRMLADNDRKPLRSDPVDRQHITFMPLVDVFTADRYTYSKIGEFDGAADTCPIPKAYSRTIVIRATQLANVADCLRAIAGELAGLPVEPG